MTSPVATLRRSTVFFFGEMETASQPVRTSMPNMARNVCSVASSRLDSSGITPPTWYGSPQFAYETYGPRSTMRISAFSSSRRSRAAQEAPPATPPTMMTFMISLLSCTDRAQALPNRGQRLVRDQRLAGVPPGVRDRSIKSIPSVADT